MPERITVAYTNTAGNRRRVRFERRSVGGWDRYVEEFDGDRWRPVGEEIVADLTVEVDAAVTGAVDIVPELDGHGHVVRGPEVVDR